MAFAVDLTPTLNDSSDYNRGEQGYFAEYPMATPKYAVNNGLRDNEFKENLARFYISLAGVSGANPDRAIEDYVNSVPPEARDLARVLVGSSSTAGGTGFIDFMLQQVNESFTEVAQIEKVLSDNYVAFFFGSEPPVFQYAGTLLNTVQDNHRIGMAIAYQHLIRGTQLARRGALLRLRYDDVIVSGTVMNMSQIMNAENEIAVPFNFSLLVKEYLVIKAPARVTTKVATAFSDPQLLSKVGSVVDFRSQTLMVPTNLSRKSSAGDDVDAPAQVETPKQKEASANAAAAASNQSTSDVSTDTSNMSIAPQPAPMASFPSGG